MKKMNVLLLLSCFYFVACTGFEQDPYKSKDDAIRNAKEIIAKPEKPKAISSDVVSLEVPNIIKVKEGVPATVDFKLKSFLNGYNYSYEVQNIDLFKGAAFDSKSQKLSWTAPMGVIPFDSENREMEMSVSIIATPIDLKIDKVLLQATQKITFLVELQKTTPTIIEVRPATLSIEEGSVTYGTVYVEDNGSDASSTILPTIAFSGRLSSFAFVTSTQYLSSIRNWKIDFKIDLKNQELTKSLDSTPLQIVAMNRFKNFSSVALLPLQVLTQMGQAKTNFDNNVVLTTDIFNSIPFVIYDSNNELMINIKSKNNLPLGAVINCQKSIMPFQQCQLEWTPTAAHAGQTFNVSLETEMKSTHPSDSRVVQNLINLTFKVKTK